VSAGRYFRCQGCGALRDRLSAVVRCSLCGRSKGVHVLTWPTLEKSLLLDPSESRPRITGGMGAEAPHASHGDGQPRSIELCWPPRSVDGSTLQAAFSTHWKLDSHGLGREDESGRFSASV
jgi:hypothetical protein